MLRTPWGRGALEVGQERGATTSGAPCNCPRVHTCTCTRPEVHISRAVNHGHLGLYFLTS